MLQAMPQTATPSPASPSFAGLLAALALPASATAEGAPAWNDDDLADDVATLSYERALRAHSRYQHAVPSDRDPTDRSLLQSAEPAPIPRDKELRADRSPGGPEATPRSSQYSHADFQPKGNLGLSPALERDLKSASITIRLSKAENVQLRQRAAQAGLTISAYLRSCTFEAESLRALVKDTLAQLRSSPPSPNRSNAKKVALSPARHSWFGWLLKLLPRWHSSQRAARA
jgi:hypothetical protein